GVAQIDPTRCLTWTENRSCTVCHDTCPVPGGAIRLVAEETQTPSGERIRVQRPHVRQERCNGCGICAYNCPIEGEGAVRVRPM
ncbi:MAG: 4Fe-4S dicluster domain-containing protein, partial [Chloroflexia bacterium]